LSRRRNIYIYIYIYRILFFINELKFPIFLSPPPLPSNTHKMNFGGFPKKKKKKGKKDIHSFASKYKERKKE